MKSPGMVGLVWSSGSYPLEGKRRTPREPLTVLDSAVHMEGDVLHRMSIVIGAVLAAWVVLLFVLRSMKRARTGSKGLRSAGWALLFLFSGRMPPPPPETQIELERHTEKDREASRDVDS
jgi:hypothetical protein